MTKVEKLTERVDSLTPPPKPNDHGVYHRAAKLMTKDEQVAVIHATEALVATGMKEPTDAWLATRPPDEQAAVRKLLGLLKQFEKEETMVRS